MGYMGIYCIDCCVKLDDVNGYFRYIRGDGVKIYGERCKTCRHARDKQYRKTNDISVRYKEYQHEYRLTHADRLRENKRIWREKNRDVVKAKRRETHRLYRQRLWNEAINFFGPCACCGEHRQEFLSIDHINGGGRQKRLKNEELSGWSRLIKFSTSGWPESLKLEYRILCHNCNQAMGAYGYCPHERSGLYTVFGLNHGRK